jgi:putative endonuclease
MSETTRDKGIRGEDLAARRLVELGYVIIERNYVCKVGEVDIIAQNGEYLVFIEVRSRDSAHSVPPEYSIGPRKRRKLVRSAEYYLTGLKGPVPACRFDVCIVDVTRDPKVEVIVDAFTAD